MSPLFEFKFDFSRLPMGVDFLLLPQRVPGSGQRGVLVPLVPGEDLAFADFKSIFVTLAGLTEIEAELDLDVAGFSEDRHGSTELAAKPSVGFRPGLVFEEVVLFGFGYGFS